MDKERYVYHASKVSGLKVIEPRESTHKKHWVYATKSVAVSAMFLGKHSDFICQTGIAKDRPFLYEQFEGALLKSFKGYKGSIYKLNANNFREGQTTWSAEVVSEQPEAVVEEVKVSDALVFLERLEEDGLIDVYRFPNKPDCAPKDKSDIVEKAVEWTNIHGDMILEQIKEYHPDILPEVLRRIGRAGG